MEQNQAIRFLRDISKRCQNIGFMKITFIDIYCTHPTLQGPINRLIKSFFRISFIAYTNQRDRNVFWDGTLPLKEERDSAKNMKFSLGGKPWKYKSHSMIVQEKQATFPRYLKLSFKIKLLFIKCWDSTIRNQVNCR